MFFNYFFLCLFGISTNFLADTVAREAIRDGYEVTRADQFPYLVALTRGDGSLPICGGAVISRGSILTAARCFFNNGEFINEAVFVHAGTHNLGHTGPRAEVQPIKYVYVPNEFVQAISHTSNLIIVDDIAIAKVSNPEALSQYALHEFGSSQTDYTDVVAVFAGWGNRRDVLKYSSVTVLSNERCQQLYHRHWINEHSMLCAKLLRPPGSKPYGVCQSDEGGPLVYNGIIIGVLSLIAPNCDERSSSAIYTRVSDFPRFITSGIRDNSNSDRRRFDLPILEPRY